MLVLVVGVFILPVLGLANLLVSGWMFALSIVIFGLAPVVLAGHYELYRSPTFPSQEKRALVVALVLLVAFLLFAGLAFALRLPG